MNFRYLSLPFVDAENLQLSARLLITLDLEFLANTLELEAHLKLVARGVPFSGSLYRY